MKGPRETEVDTNWRKCNVMGLEAIEVALWNIATELAAANDQQQVRAELQSIEARVDAIEALARALPSSRKRIRPRR